MKKRLFNNENTLYYLLYTLVFTGIFLLLFRCFYINGKSLIWKHDGVPQHLNALAYYGKYLRGILYSVFVEHKPKIPMWDLHIGYGSDILTTLHYYVIGDPLTLLSVFVPADKTEYLYEALIFLRIWLAGITFSGFCFYHKNPKRAVFLGTLIYIFAGWTIYAAMKHPYFANPMIYLPLMLKGVDKIYNGEKPWLYIWSVALSGASNFYFFYMLGIFTVLYAVFRYFYLIKEHPQKLCFLPSADSGSQKAVITGKKQFSLRNILHWLTKFALYSVIGILIASVILLPVLLPLFGTGRFKAENYVPLFYEKIYYEKYLGCLLGENMTQWGVAGYTAVSMTGVFVLFARRKKNIFLKAGFLLLNVFLLIPWFGHALNGFSYVSNRWIWAYGMLLAYIFVRAYPAFFELTIKEKRRVFVMLLVYCCLTLLPVADRTQRNMTAMLLLLVATFNVLCYGSIFVRTRTLTGLTCFLLIAGIGFNIYYQYSLEKDYISEFADSGTGMKKLKAGTDMAVLNTGDTSLYRYDQMDASSCDNSSMQTGTNGTSYYFSVADSGIGTFFDEMYLNTPWEQHYENLDSRTILDRLAAVKYFVVRENGRGYLPYGFYDRTATAVEENKAYIAYKNENSLPFGYTYDSWISRKDYENMSVTEKQQALLQGVVLEDSTLKKAEPEFNDQEISYKMTSGKGCRVTKDGDIRVTSEGAELTLTFDGLKNSETYLITEGLDYDALSPRELVSDTQWEKKTRYEKNQILREDSNWLYWEESKKASITVSGLFPEKTIRVFTDKYNAYSGKHNFLCNTGYREGALGRITLTFNNTGVYSFDSLKIVCQPMDRVDEQTAALGEETLQNITMETNGMTGTISLSKPKALILSLPYSKGWTAFVDGKETSILKANTMYMALELDAGEHEIRLVYCTPYLKAGLGLTCAGIVCYSCLVIITRRKKRIE